MNGRLSFIVMTALLVSACVQPAWVYDGKRYTDRVQLQNDMDANFNSLLANLKPLQQPVTNRDLKIFMPDKVWLIDTKLEYIRIGTPLATRDMISNDILFNTNYTENSRLEDLIRKKNIFRSVSKIATTGNQDVQPSDDYDALVYSTATKPPAIDQFYYVSKRNGKQIIAFDQNLTSIQERVESQLNAIKGAALQ
jgi:hypothetical protein